MDEDNIEVSSPELNENMQVILDSTTVDKSGNAMRMRMPR